MEEEEGASKIPSLLKRSEAVALREGWGEGIEEDKGLLPEEGEVGLLFEAAPWDE